jgi:hypothetical protein
MDPDLIPERYWKKGVFMLPFKITERKDSSSPLRSLSALNNLQEAVYNSIGKL